MGKVTVEELRQIARLATDHAQGPGTWDRLGFSEQLTLIRHAEHWTKCIDAILSRTRRTA